MPRPTSQDLAGYWDMLQLSVEDVGMKFDELHQLKLNGWKIMESPERKVSVCALRRPPPPPSLAPPGARGLTNTVCCRCTASRTSPPLGRNAGADFHRRVCA